MADLSHPFSEPAVYKEELRTWDPTLASTELIYGFHKILIKIMQDALYCLTNNSEND